MNIFKTALIALLMSSSFAFAQFETPQATGYVGLGLGYADPTNMDGRMGYGVNAGLIFPNGLSGNIFALNSEGDDVSLMQYGLGVDFALRGLLGDSLGFLKAGLKIGMSDMEVETPIGDMSDEGFFWGPSISADYMVTEAFSLGGEVDVLFTSGDKVGDYSMLYILGTGKYWF